jgi:dolichol kinase
VSRGGLVTFWPLDIRPVALVATAAGQTGLLVAVEIGFRRGLGPETTRQIAHVIGASSVAFLPLFLRLSEIMALAVVFTAVLAWTRARHLLSSVHGIHRVTVGAVIFPAGLLLAVLLAWQHPRAIAYGALVLAAADPAAAVIGKRFRSIAWPVVGGRKTGAGSLAFALVTIGIGLLIGFGVGDVRVLAVVAAALVLALIEGSVGYGLDNLPVPAVASLLGVALLGL